MTKQEEDAILGVIKNSLGNMDLRDIQVCQRLRKYKVPLATFILCSCFIDHMAQYTYYDPKHPKAVGDRFMKFIDNYLPQYGNSGKLYTFLRSNLVHNYSVSGKYYLGFRRNGKHLVPHKNGKTWLNLHKLIADLQHVFKEFCDHIVNDQTKRKSALDHYAVYEVLQAKNP
jgi:hypothetical protein